MNWDGVVNIGAALGTDLNRVGVPDLARLEELGVIEVGRRLRSAGRHDCTNAILALEGALRGVRWTELSPSDRYEITNRWKDCK
jgi:DNA transformation protein